MIADGVRPAVAEAVDGSGVLGSTPWRAPVLPGCLERSSTAWGKIPLRWVQQRLPEMEGGVCCSSGRLGGTGELLEDSWVCVGAWKGLRDAVEGDRSRVDFLVELAAGVCCGAFGLW